MLHAGGRVVFAQSGDPQQAFELIAAEGVTITALVPPLALAWLEQAPALRPDLSSLRLLQVGGARLGEETARRVGPLLGCRLQQVFGMAEGLVCYTRADDDEALVASTQGRPISPADEIRIVDDDDVELPPGAVGNLLTRGPYTIRGYFDAPEHNARAFTVDGFYRTGDLARQLPSGHLVVEGRVKDLINRGGDKVAAEEVEHLLLGHASVLDVALVAMPDDFLGERSCAFVIARGTPPTLAELKRFLRDDCGVADFKLPDRLELLPGFPQTGVGKVNKKALREMIAARLAAERAAAATGTVVSGADLRAHDLRAALAGLVAGTVSNGEEDAAAFPRLVTFNQGAVYVGRFSGVSPWECHPDADELLHVLDGKVEVTLLSGPEPVLTLARAGSALVVPRGVWHRQWAENSVTLLAVTPDRSEISFEADPRTDPRICSSAKEDDCHEQSIPQIDGYPMPAPGAWSANRTGWRPERHRCALLIHDMQRHFLQCYPADAAPLRDLLTNIAALRRRCHALGVPVFYSQAGAQTPAERGLVSDFWGAGMDDKSGASAIVDALAPTTDDVVINKHRYSAFHRTELLDQLRSRGRDQLLICGVYAHIGCLATALDAFMHNVQAFMLADALGDLCEQEHLMALSYTARRCGAVLSCSEALAALDDGAL